MKVFGSRFVFVLASSLLLASSVAAQAPGTRLQALFDAEWNWRLAEYPELKTAVGIHDADDRLSDTSLAAQERRIGDTRKFADQLHAIDRAALSADEQINYDIFETQLFERVESFRFGEQYLTLNADSGFHTGLPQMSQGMPAQSVKDFDNYLSRLRGVPQVFVDQVAAMREGLKRGITPPRVTLEGVEKTVEIQMVDDATKSAFWKHLERIPDVVPAAEKARLQAEGKKIIGEQIVPAYRRFHDFLVKEYLPGCRKTLAASELPNGADYYRFLIRQYTTIPGRTAEQVHQTGLDEMKRIRAEMDEVIRQVGFKGTFAEFLQFLRTDPRFYPKTAEELIKEGSYIAKQMDGKLPMLIKTLPRKPYTVVPVPAHLAPKYTAGRAAGSPKDAPEPSYYWLNTYALDTRPLYNLEALTFHEAAPGHLIQGALAEEQESLPNFRRYSYISAYGEGWGLYSEWLGIEAGFYKDPYSNFGRLTYQAWRACRLVVDTGVHAMGWSRQQVMDYLAQNTALSLHEVETETDRYISWPGQALSYYTGFLKIRELRAKAEKALGPDFDRREFHDAILLVGAVPLPVLEKRIDRYIADVQSARKKSAG
jgi:uncharacterized protein (DUF885 family)